MYAMMAGYTVAFGGFHARSRKKEAIFNAALSKSRRRSPRHNRMQLVSTVAFPRSVAGGFWVCRWVITPLAARVEQLSCLTHGASASTCGADTAATRQQGSAAAYCRDVYEIDNIRKPTSYDRDGTNSTLHSGLMQLHLKC